jgi:hypothetical protein
VKVRGGKSETSHVVTVPSGFAGTLGATDVPGEELVRASFVFLLDREPASSILTKFSLDIIARYFPEYPTELRRYVASPDKHSPDKHSPDKPAADKHSPDK